MHREFKKLLKDAVGQSEFLIAVNLDIRGFSSFSKNVESPETAIFIKRVYTHLIEKYFPLASFFKPTGDGLLLTIPYKENNLQSIAQKTFETCLNVLRDFGSICSGDPMINFEVPRKIGIGISRGTACKLISKGKTLDYSGRVLNLASRLMELARPTGIVFDADFEIGLLRDDQLPLFTKDSVYIRGISEREPIEIYYTKDITEIVALNKQPIEQIKWTKLVDKKILKKIIDLGPRFIYELQSVPIEANQINVKVTHPLVVRGRKRKNFVTTFDFKDFKYQLDGGKPVLIIQYNNLASRLQSAGIKSNWEVEIEILYPKR